MSERLRPRDLAFLATESPTTPMHNATVEIFDPGDSGFDYDRLVAADRRPDRVRAALPAAAPVGARPAGQPGLGRRRGLRPRLPRTPLRAAAAGHHGPAARARRPDHLAAARPQPAAVGVYFVEGLDERPRRAAVQVPPDPRRRRARPSTSVRCCSTPRPTAKTLGTTTTGGRARTRRPRRGRRSDAVTDSLESPRTVVHTARQRRARSAAQAPPRPAPGRRGRHALASRGPVRRSPVNRRLSQQRRFVAVRTDLADYRAIREVHGGTVNDVILATVTGGLRGWLMARAESMAGLKTLKAIVPMSVIDDELEATSLGTQIAGHLRRTCRSASPARWSGCTRSPTPSRPTARPAGPSPRTGWPGIAGFAPTTFHALGSRRRRRGAAPGLPPLGHQRARPAVPAVRRRRADARDLPRPPAAARPRAGDRRDVVRRRGLLRHHRRPRRCCPTSTCSASASLEALDELSDTASPTPGRAPRAAARRSRPRRTEVSTRVYLPPPSTVLARLATTAGVVPALGRRACVADGRRRGDRVRRADDRRRRLVRAARRAPDGRAAGSCVVAETPRRRAARSPGATWSRCTSTTDDDADPDDDLAWFAAQEIARPALA